MRAGRGETPHTDDPHDGWVKTPESDGDLANLLSVRRFSNVQSSPHGSRVAFLQGGLRVQDGTGSEKLVYPGSVGSYLWLNEDFLAFSYDRNGDEQWRLGLTRADGQPFATRDGSERAYLRLSDNENASHQLCFAAPEGLYYRSTALDSSDSDIHRFDPKTGEHHLVYRGTGQTEPVGIMPDGRLLVHQGLSNVDNNLLAYDPLAGRSQLLTPHDGNCTYVPDAFVTPEQMLCLSNQGSETVTACLLHTGSGELRHLFASTWDTEAISYQGESGRLACVFNENGYSRLGMFHLPSATWASCPPLPEGVVSQLSWSGPDTLRFCFTGPDRPGSLAELHVRSGELRWLKEAEFARHPGALVKPTAVHYASHDGLTIPALLYRSPVETGAAVVHLHGGPETQHRPRFDPLVQHLTSLGISVLALPTCAAAAATDAPSSTQTTAPGAPTSSVTCVARPSFSSSSASRPNASACWGRRMAAISPSARWPLPPRWGGPPARARWGCPTWKLSWRPPEPGAKLRGRPSMEKIPRCCAASRRSIKLATSGRPS